MLLISHLNRLDRLLRKRHSTKHLKGKTYDVKTVCTVADFELSHQVAIMDWCEDNLKHRYTYQSHYDGGMFIEADTPMRLWFKFQDENDAFAFKMRWG